MVAKLILTPVSIGGGFVGGVFAPALFIGAMLGGAYGEIAQRLFPTLPIVPGAYKMVGMAAVLAGAVHAPLTAILLFFEMTNDYRIILPVMLAVAVSLLVSQSLQRDSVYALGLARKGIRLDRGRDVELMEGITVGEVMQTDFITLNETDSLEVAAQVFRESRHHGLAVVDSGGDLVGILTVQDLDRAATGENLAQFVSQVCTLQPLTAYPDESMGAALRRMGTRDIGRLPVVARENPQRLVGILSRTDIVRAYDIAFSRRAVLRDRAHQVHLGAFRGDPVSVVELEIETGSACANQAVKGIAWPRDCIISSLRRRGRLIIPHGDTVLLPGDVLVVVAEGPAIQWVTQLCKRTPTDNG